jgi:AcrR family transcriptional regulator
LAEHGLQGASTNRIIRAAGLSKGGLYYYFDDRDDLVATAVGDAVSAMLAAVGPARPPSGSDEFWAEVTRVVTAGATWFGEHPEVMAMLHRLSSEGPRVPPALHPVAMRVALVIAGAVDAGQRVGAVRSDLPQDLLVEVVVSVASTADRWLLRTASDGDLAGRVVTVVDLYRRVAAP